MSWGASVNPRGVLLYSWSAWICGLVEFRMMRPDFLVSKWCTRLPSYWVCSTWLQSINHILDLLFCLSALKAGRRTSTTQQPWHSSPSNIGQLGHFAFHLINLLILMQKSHTVSCFFASFVSTVADEVTLPKSRNWRLSSARFLVWRSIPSVEDQVRSFTFSPSISIEARRKYQE